MAIDAVLVAEGFQFAVSDDQGTKIDAVGLFWRVGRVILIWRWLGGRWLGASPVLLASS